MDLIRDEWPRNVLRRAGLDPDDAESLRGALEAHEPPAAVDWILSGFRSDAEAAVPASWEPALRELVFFEGRGAADRQAGALALLARMLGARALAICRAALDDRRFVFKPAAVHGIARYGDGTDVPRIVAWIRRTVERRKENYAGGNPIAEGAAFFRRVDAGAAEVLKRWLTVRWYRVWPDFRDGAAAGDGLCSWYVPPFAELPPVAAVVGGEDCVGALQSLLAGFCPRVRTVFLPHDAERVATLGRVVIAADAASARKTVRWLDRLERPVPLLRMPAPWAEGARGEAISRKTAAYLAERLAVVGLL